MDGLPIRPTNKELRIHLLMPLGSSVLVILGLLLLKRAQEHGASAWTTMILVCWASGAVFILLTLLGGTMQPVSLWWQPALIGGLYLLGQLLMFSAVKWGDVSIAAPVLGVKVVMVPAVAMLVVDEASSPRIWLAAAVALVGVVFLQLTDATVQRSRVLAAVAFSLLAALTMTLFDLLIQRWAPAWGPGFFLPLAFGFSALYSIAFLPLAERPRELSKRDIWLPLLVGSVLMAFQAIGMTLTLAQYGDATRVNIVYSLRGLWGVLLTWLLSERLRITNQLPSNRLMLLRLIGALLIAAAVIISVG